MKLRGALVIAAALFSFAACHGAPSASSIPALPAARTSSGSSGSATVIVTLPVIAAASPVPTPSFGPERLSSGTQSLTGTFGSHKIGPIALNAQTPGCTTGAGGLHCSLSLQLPVATQALILHTYGTPSGTGQALATSNDDVSVFAGQQNYVTPHWAGLAASFKIWLSQTNLRQGTPAAVEVALEGVDASGAVIPENDIEDSNRKRVRAQIEFPDGYPIPEFLALPHEAGFAPATFDYDGRLSRKVVVKAISLPPRAKATYAASTLNIAPGAAGKGQLFVWGYGGTLSQRSYPPLLAQYAAGASGNSAPLRTYFLNGPPIWASSSGAFWAGPFPAQSRNAPPAYLEEYNASGAGQLRLSPASGLPITFAYLDANENMYAVEGTAHPFGIDCNFDGYFEEYSGVNSWKPVRSFSFGSCPVSIAADKHGNFFVAPDQDSLSSSPTGSITEYGPGATYSSGSITYVGTPLPVTAIAVDSRGSLYALCETSLFEVWPHTSTTKAILPGVAVKAFAFDAKDDLYVATGGSIEEFAPGSSTPMRTLSLASSGITTVGAIVAAQ